jgi:predicted nucleic acid-binding Zn ribbon protein
MTWEDAEQDWNQEDLDDPWLGDLEPESYTEPCPNCGADLAEDTVRCWNCGEYPSEGQRKMNPLWIALILLLIGLMILGSIF